MYSADYLSAYPYFAALLERIPVESALDSLTGLIARPYMLGFIRERMERKEAFTLFILDLDNFKSFNDHYGHKVGDRVLSRVSEQLRLYLGEDGIAGRYGGDEFLVVYTKSIVYDEVHDFFMRLYRKGDVLRRNYMIDDRSLYVTGTIGSAVFPKDAQLFDELFARVDKALYRGKSKGRNCFIMYVPSKHDALQIPTLSKRSLYETFRRMADGFDRGEGILQKLSCSFEPLRENLHLDRLLLLQQDGWLTDTRDGTRLEQVSVPQQMTEPIFAVSSMADLDAGSGSLRSALSALELESVMFAQASAAGGKPVFLLLCPERHTGRIWQDDEYAAAFILARMLTQHLHQ